MDTHEANTAVVLPGSPFAFRLQMGSRVLETDLQGRNAISRPERARFHLSGPAREKRYLETQGGRMGMDWMEQLSKVPLFHGLPVDQLQDLKRIAVEKVTAKGDLLFHEGERAEGFYVVLSGRVKIYKVSLDGKEQILHIFGEGEVFGEVPVFAGGNYPAHAEILEKGRVLFFSRSAFIELVKGEPALALNMLSILSLRLRRFTHMVEDLSLKEVPSRLAAHLLYLGERNPGEDTLELEITKSQLASLLGTIPETLSRILARMTQQGIIRVEGRSIRVLDREMLQALAEGEKLPS